MRILVSLLFFIWSFDYYSKANIYSASDSILLLDLSIDTLRELELPKINLSILLAGKKLHKCIREIKINLYFYCMDDTARRTLAFYNQWIVQRSFFLAIIMYKGCLFSSYERERGCNLCIPTYSLPYSAFFMFSNLLFLIKPKKDESIEKRIVCGFYVPSKCYYSSTKNVDKMFVLETEEVLFCKQKIFISFKCIHKSHLTIIFRHNVFTSFA